MGSRGPWHSPWALALFAAAAAGAINVFLLVRGIRFSPDSWVYWQGSVSLLQGAGYTTFDHHPIRLWPPVYPLYLAVMQALLGVSGRTLAVATGVLAAGAAFAWTFAFARGTSKRAGASAYAVLLPLSFALFVAPSFEALLADHLALALMGVAAALALPRQLGDERRWGRTAWVALVLALLIGAKNSALAFVPAVACLAWASESRPVAWPALARAAFVVVAPVAAWLAMRAALGQGGSHALDLDAGRDPLLWAGVLFASVAQMLLPAGGGIAKAACMAALLALLALLLRDRTIPESDRRSIAAWVLALFVYAGALIAVLILTVVDRPEGRFIWCLPIGLIGALWFLGARASSRLRVATGVFLGGLLAAQATKVGTEAYHGWAHGAPSSVEWHHTIDPAFTGPGSSERGDLLLIAPPPPLQH